MTPFWSRSGSVTNVLLSQTLKVWPVEAGAADVAEEDAADAAENADWRRHGVDEREAELGVGVEALVAEELAVLVAAHFGVAAEVGVIRAPTPALEAVGSQGEHAVPAKPHVVARVAVERLRDSELPTFGATSNDSRMVLPDNGPYSRNTVVSWMKETPSGIIKPLLKNCVPNSSC